MSYHFNRQLLKMRFIFWIILLVSCAPSKQVNSPSIVSVPYPKETVAPSPFPADIIIKYDGNTSQSLTPEAVETPDNIDLEPQNTPTNIASAPTGPSPTATHLPSPTPYLLKGPLIAFDAENSENGEGTILVFDTSIGFSRAYTPEQLGGAIAGFDWSQTGCNLFVAIQNSGTVQYVTVDLTGNVSKPISQPIPSITDEGSRFAWTISSTQEWIAFLLGFGKDEEGFDFGFKDTWVIKNNQENSSPLALTQNSWTLEPAWSPSGDRLAFTNHDSAGIPQLYHSAPDGSDLVQVTHFFESIDHIQGIRWSPDGRWLSFNTFNNEGWPLPPGQSFLWSVTRDGQNLHQAQLGDFVIRQASWWSDDSESYSAYVELWSEEINRGKLGSKIVWVSPEDGMLIHEFIPDKIKFEHVFPVGGNEIIGFLGANYTQYEKATGSVIQVGDSPSGSVFPREITPLYGPYNFEGEASCNQ